MITPPPLPPLFRFANWVGGCLDAIGLPPVRIEPEALVARAVAETGLTDLGEPGWEVGLERLCRSAREDASLTLIGRLALQDITTEALITRLRRIDVHKTRPEVFRTALTPPLIVVGLPRSGTTHLHRLLALGSDARTLPFWELRKPIAGPGPDRRRELISERFKRMTSLVPELDAKHKTSPDEPEECMMLLDSTLASLTFWVFVPVFGYLEWFIEQDARPLYQVYREHLQLFQAGSPGQRLTLKAPAHTPFVDALLEAVPEAHLIQTHREPVTVLASATSLFFTFHRMTTDRLDVPRMGRALTDMLVSAAERNMEARTRLPPDTILDIRYDDLVRDAEGVIDRIYDRFGLPLDDAFRARLRAAIRERPQHAHGVHEYNLADYGMDTATIAPRFDAYRQRFLA